MTCACGALARNGTCARCAARAAEARWRARNPEKVAAKQVAHNARRRANRAAERERERAYRKAHPEVDKRKNVTRLARLRGAHIETVDPAVVFARDGGVCGLCELPVPSDAYTIDHIVQLVHGGEHSYANVQVAHHSCNSAKNSRAA